MKTGKLKAFTALEVILVLGILGTLLGLSLLYGQGTSIRTDLQTQVSLFVAELRLAQSKAESGQNSGTYGIHLDTNSYTIFEGNTYNASASGNIVKEIPETIVIQNISLSGSGSEIFFVPPNGETTQTGTLEFHSNPLNETTQISINSQGYASY